MNYNRFQNDLQLNDKTFIKSFANPWHKEIFMNSLRENKSIVILLSKKLNFYISN